MANTGSLVIKINEKCYISPQVGKGYPFNLSIEIYYGTLCAESSVSYETAAQTEESESGAGYSAIRIAGLEKLTGGKMQEFAAGLSVNKECKDIFEVKAAKSVEGKDELLIKGPVSEDELPDDFCLTLTAHSFICMTREPGDVILKAAVKNFPCVDDCVISAKTTVQYVVYAESVAFTQNEKKVTAVDFGTQVNVEYSYLGEDADKELTCNGAFVSSGNSPYVAAVKQPSLFKLTVFDRSSGIRHSKDALVGLLPPEIMLFKADKEYFCKDERITLTWDTKSAASVRIIGLCTETDVFDESKREAAVYPGQYSASECVYILTAIGYDENGNSASVHKNIRLNRTNWCKKGRVSDQVFTESIYKKQKGNGRIFVHKDVYYFYSHPNLYQSTDGLNWSALCVNESAAAGYAPAASDYHDGRLYVMGKAAMQEEEGRYSCIYDFALGTWSYDYAGYFQSMKGCFAFSPDSQWYAQILSKGMLYAMKSDKIWNRGSAVVNAEPGKTVKGGDIHYFTGRLYIAMLYGDDSAVVYEQSGESAGFPFTIKGCRGDCIEFVEAAHNLYLITGSAIINVLERKTADAFIPPSEGEKCPVIGECGEKIVGVYPDGNLWDFIPDR